MSNKKISTKQMVLCSIFTALVIVGAFIKIPTYPVPVTLQIVFTNLAGLILGGSLGALSIIIYVILGLIGIPVFTAGGGIAYIFKPTFGYLLAFIVGAYVAGKIVEKDKEFSFKKHLFASVINLVIVYTIGVLYMYLMMNFYLGQELPLANAIKAGALLPFPGNIVLIIISLIVLKRVWPAIKKNLDK